MKTLSIIIPAYNSAKTLSICLQSVFESISLDDEVIVVNDSSGDSTKEIAECYNCKIINFNHNAGPSAARNAGARIAKNEILVFIDSDMLISKDSLEKIRSYFQINHTVQSLTLNFEIDKRKLNYPTKYKSHYMSYVTYSKDENVNYIYGSYCATKKNGFIFWPENLRYTEDSLWGHEQSQMGYQIHCIKEIKATHLKIYTLIGVIKNDFRIAFYFSINFWKNKRWGTLFGDEKFGHTSKKQMLSIALAVISFIILPWSVAFFISTVVLWLFINYNFLNFILKHNDVYFLAKTIIYYYVLNLAYATGISIGSLVFLTNGLIDKRIKLPT